MGTDAGLLVVTDHLPCIVLLAVVALVGHGNLRGLQFRGHLDSQLAEQGDAFLVAEQGAALAVELGAPVGGAIQVLVNGGGLRVGAIHLPFQGFELGQSDVTGAAFRTGGACAIKRAERFAALVGQFGFQDVGGGMEIAL